MVPDQAQAAFSSPPLSGGTPLGEKVRIRFRKGGDLRLLSHHDLLRCFERMLRRSNLPFRTTAGFNPRPRLVFALSLPLGIVGCEEAVELELNEVLSPEEVQDRLTRQAPPGLTILSVQRISPRTKAQVRRVSYRVLLPADQTAELSRRVADLLAAPACWIERTRPRPRRLDVRHYLDQLRVLPDALEMDLWVLPTGLARPEEVLRLLGLEERLTTELIYERTRVELFDEQPISVTGTSNTICATSLPQAEEGNGPRGAAGLDPAVYPPKS